MIYRAKKTKRQNKDTEKWKRERNLDKETKTSGNNCTVRQNDKETE